MLFCLLQNCSVGIVGKDEKFTVFEDEEVAKFVSFDEFLTKQKALYIYTWNWIKGIGLDEGKKGGKVGTGAGNWNHVCITSCWP